MADVPRIDIEDINRSVSPEIGGPPSSAGTGTPSAGEIYRRRAARQQSFQRWQNMSTGEKVSAVGQAGIRAVPLAGKPIHEYAFGGDNQDIEAARVGAPMTTFGAESVGGGIPYMMGGPTSLAGRAMSGALIGGADALVEGQDPIRGAMAGGLGSGSAHFLPAAITPRPVLRDIRRQSVDLFERGHLGTPEYRQQLGEFMRNKMPPNQWGNRRIYDVLKRQYENQWIEDTYNILARGQGFKGRPDIDISKRFGAISRTLGGAGLGWMFGMEHPGIAAALGLAAGPVSRGAQNVIDRVVDNPAFMRYINNELMGTTGSRSIHGPATGAATQFYEDRIPQEFAPYEALRSQIMGPRRNAP